MLSDELMRAPTNLNALLFEFTAPGHDIRFDSDQVRFHSSQAFTNDNDDNDDKR